MKNTKAFVVWKRNVRSIPTSKLIEIRNELGVPVDGFQSDEDCKKWENNNNFLYSRIYKKLGAGSMNNELKETTLYKQLVFQDGIKEKYPEISHGFDEAIENLILFNQVPDWIIEKCDATGCKIEIVGGNKKEIDDGVYIRISSHTTLEDIKRFLSLSGSKLGRYKNLVYDRKNVRYKAENFSKNEIVFQLSLFSLEELKEIYTKNFEGDKEKIEFLKSTDSVACLIMEKIDHKINPDNYRRILSRERTRRK